MPTTPSRTSTAIGLSAVAQLAYLLSAESTIAGAVGASDVRYDKDISKPFEYDRYDAYLGYDDKTRQFKFNLAAGYSWLDSSTLDNDSGPLLRASATWTPSATTTLSLGATREFTDSGEALIVDPTQIDNLGIGSGNNNAVVSPQVYVLEELIATFGHTQGNVHFDIAPFWRDYNYVGHERAEPALVRISCSRCRLADASEAHAGRRGLGREHRDYTDVDRVDDDKTYWLGVGWQQSRHWSWRGARRQHSSRDSHQLRRRLFGTRLHPFTDLHPLSWLADMLSADLLQIPRRLSPTVALDVSRDRRRRRRHARKTRIIRFRRARFDALTCDAIAIAPATASADARLARTSAPRGAADVRRWSHQPTTGLHGRH